MSLRGSLSGSPGVSRRQFPQGALYYDPPPSQSGPVALPATVGAHSIPGPAAGYIRLFFMVTANTTTATAATLAFQFYTNGTPGLFLWRAFSLAATSASNSGGVGPAGIYLAYNETLEVVNTGSGDAVLWYAYRDVPATNLTPVRIQCGLTPVDAIPAAASGYYNRIVHSVAGFGGSPSPRAHVYAVNDDTASAQLCTYIGGTLTQRTGAAGAGVNFAVQNWGDYKITTGALAFGTRAAVTTRNVNVYLVYETLPL